MMLFIGSHGRRHCSITFACALLSAFSSIFEIGVLVSADFGDYVDPTYNCPAIVTCPQVCVADASLCPSELDCSGSGGTLCADGHCAAAGTVCDATLGTPCTFNCANVACARSLIDPLTECKAMFGNLYDAETACGAAEVAATPQVSITGPSFIFCYTWLAFSLASLLGWCAYNQRISPRRDVSSSPLEEAVKDRTSASGRVMSESSQWTQTAYYSAPGLATDRFTLLQVEGIIATLLYCVSFITLWGLQALLAILTIFYYIEQGAINRWPDVFQDERQVLLCFEIVWAIGFVYSMSLQWPYSLRSLFLRRCSFSHATYVAVFAPNAVEDAGALAAVNDIKGSRHVEIISHIITPLRRGFCFLMTSLFSEVNRPTAPGTYMFCKVEVDNDGNRFFYFRLRRYNYDVASRIFVPGVWRPETTIGGFLKAKNGLTSAQVSERKNAIGPNSIRLRKPSIFCCIQEEFSKPFYVYQNFILWTWFPVWYFYMAFVQSFVRITGGLLISYFKYCNDANLYKLSHVSGEVIVLRDGAFSTISQKDIVPGDVIRVQPGITFCDMVIISSDHIIVDESALTGEATPIAKTEVDKADSERRYLPSEYKLHTVSAGSTVLEACDKSLAVVTKTGSFTTKGELLRDVLSYHRHKFKFDVEVQIVIVILFCYAIFGFSLAVYFLQEDPVFAWFYGMYVVAASLPPLLPTVFIVSVGISDNRLAKKRVACSNSEGILVAGKVKIACFDKTGTLTRQGLDFLSSISAGKSDVDEADLNLGMAVCHTLSKSTEGRLVGNSVDQIMFGATGATMDAKTGGPIVVTDKSGMAATVLKRFEFDHHRMTQSVVVRDANESVSTFVKGSAESIRRLCKKNSLPLNFDEISNKHARQGIYQIVIAKGDSPFGIADDNGQVEVSDISRDDVERNLKFVGFVNFKNMLKEDTAGVLQELREGDVRSYMITGDSVLTGIHIARECGLIDAEKMVVVGSSLDENGKICWTNGADDSRVPSPTLQGLQSSKSHVEVAVTGAVWAQILSESPVYATQLAPYVRVYGRCTPNDKVAVVSTFVRGGFITLMCGDGGNDCGALKTAHVGVALSDAEASTVSPFTSLDKSISSVTDILKEGRCALASAFSSYKFMLTYGQLTTINQLSTAYLFVTFSDWSWVFLDGVWVLSLAFSLPLAKAAKKLAPNRPTSSLLGPHTMISFCGIMLINVMFLLIALFSLFHRDWFQCRKWGSTDITNVLVISDNYEASVIFIITGFQYMASASAYNFGFQYRAYWIKNYVFVFFITGFCLVNFLVALVPSRLSCFYRINCTNDNVVRNVLFAYVPITNPFATTVIPEGFRWGLFAMLVSNFILNSSFEYFFVNGLLKRIIANIKQKRMADSQNNTHDDAINNVEASLNISQGFKIIDDDRNEIGTELLDRGLPS